MSRDEMRLEEKTMRWDEKMRRKDEKRGRTFQDYFERVVNGGSFADLRPRAEQEATDDVRHCQAKVTADGKHERNMHAGSHACTLARTHANTQECT